MTSKPPEGPRVLDEDENEPVALPVRQVEPAAEDDTDEVTIPLEAAVLTVRNLVIFPGTVVPLTIGRAKSKLLINDVLPAQKIIISVCQRDPATEDPRGTDLFNYGTALLVLKLLRLEDGSQSIIVQGLARVKVEKWLAFEPYTRAKISVMTETVDLSTETEALAVGARNLAAKIIQLSPSVPDEASLVLEKIDQPGALADFLATNLQLSPAVKEDMLEELDVSKRLKKVGLELQHQLEVLELSRKIQDQVHENIDKSQREYFLNEQLKAIQKELGQMDEKTVEIDQVKAKLDAAGLTAEARAEADRELGRLQSMPMTSPEYHIVRTYLDWMSELPWSSASADILDINRARRILNEDHYGLDKVKRRILEYLAVRKLAPDSRGPILCFVGPPGVGKTSLGKSIARALGREFIRMSLGGVRDEAELRGHRRTYIGAMPGRIIQEIRKAGKRNPVFMLDELDKIGADFRGDPTSALLEVLDPAQNNSFQDHYLNVPFDLTKVIFIATANYMAPVPAPLRDRMEVIEISGYTQAEKLKIAKRYLVGRQLSENGLTESQAKWTDQAIDLIIDSYTREAGVRNLERQIGAVCRGIAAMIAGGHARRRTVNPKLVSSLLGPKMYESELALRTSTPGVATGLAYTPTGGVIIFVEATSYPGRGGLMLTGQIGDVMRESAQAAFSLVKSRLNGMKITSDELAATDIHVHLPAGAVPKDGPSAGVALFTALTSLLSNRAVRSDVAMTGEIALRGLVLPIGGVKQKVLAAKRAGITTVILPRQNRKDLADLPADARKDMEFVFAKNVDDVLKTALASPARPRRKSKTRKKAKSK